jgi:hypothetical protein
LIKNIVLLYFIFIFIGSSAELHAEDECVGGDCKNGYGTFIYHKIGHGLKYRGQREDNKRHGEG